MRQGLIASALNHAMHRTFGKENQPPKKEKESTDILQSDANSEEGAFNSAQQIIGGVELIAGDEEIMLTKIATNQAGNSASAVNTNYVAKFWKTSPKYIKSLKIASKAAPFVGGAITVADGLTNSFQAHHAADLAIQGVIFGVSASVPVVGWTIGAAYLLGDMYFQSTHNGISITQYYLDK